MKNIKRLCCLLTLALLSFALLAGCGTSGTSDRKWSDTDEIDCYETVTRNGEQTDVCVCHDRERLYLYHDDEAHELFDTVELPVDHINAYGENWDLLRVCAADEDGDGNDDLRIYIEHPDMNESYMVWTWEKDEGYVYQEYYSNIHYPIVVYDPPSWEEDELARYEGLWLSETADGYDYLEIDFSGAWWLYSEGNVLDEGYLWPDKARYATVMCSYLNEDIDESWIDREDDVLCTEAYGRFSLCASEDDPGQDAGL